LAAAGCTVIVDDVTYLDEPFFQSGSAIDQAIAGAIADGVSYFTAASNEGTSFYQHAFTGVAAALPGVSGSYQAMNFGTATQPNTLQSLTIAAGAAVTIDLQWDQPFASIGGGPGSADSLGMILYNASGQIVASAIANRTGGDPVQILRFDNTTGATAFHLAIVANGGSAPPNLLKYIVYGQGVTINDGNAGIGSGTVTGHEEHPGVNSVGAIAAANAPANGGNGQIESYSSVGPGTLLFDAHGNRLTDAVSGHMVDFVAPDGVATSVFAPFYGTSAAAPDAAAVAALMLQADPGLTPAQVTAMLEASAVAVKGPAGGTGAGLIQATTAVQLALAAKAATSARPGGAVTAAVAGTTTAWSTVAAEPVKQAIAALAGGRSGAADFALRIDPAAVAPAWQNTTATAFAAVYTGHGAEVYAVPDPPAHPLA
jgi:subtilisin family serine protease